MFIVINAFTIARYKELASSIIVFQKQNETSTIKIDNQRGKANKVNQTDKKFKVPWEGYLEKTWYISLEAAVRVPEVTREALEKCNSQGAGWEWRNAHSRCSEPRALSALLSFCLDCPGVFGVVSCLQTSNQAFQVRPSTMRGVYLVGRQPALLNNQL